MVVADRGDRGVLHRDRRIVDDDLIAWISSYTHALLVEEALMRDGAAGAQYQLCHP
jgi:hypothetical protein